MTPTHLHSPPQSPSNTPAHRLGDLAPGHTGTLLADTGTSPAERVWTFFATLTPQTLRSDLPRIFAPHARFKDPFNDVTGHAAIHRVFDDMYERCKHPRFVLVDRIDGGQQAFATWRFEFGGPTPDQPRWQIQGSSHWRFADDGRVLLHRDYWDTGEELYAKLPVLGSLVRLIRQRFAA